jgi:hypothetical protein
MRVPILLFSTALLLQAEPLSNTNRESLLENLEKFRKMADSVNDARFRGAIDAYRSALESDAATMSLYLDCIEKVQFKDKLKDSSEFREWKRKESDKFTNADFRLSLRYQLRWLMLALQADSKHSDASRLASDAQQCVDSIFSDYEKFVPYADILGQSATSSVFAQAYSIETTKKSKWPDSPLSLTQLYEDILLPRHRSPQHLQELRGTWIKFITQERLKQEATLPKKHDSKKAKGARDREDEADTNDPPGKSPEALKFSTETQPKLEWKMEKDLYLHGDETGAAVRMLAHLQKYLDHPSSKEWSDTFKSLLTASSTVSSPAPTPTP